MGDVLYLCNKRREQENKLNKAEREYLDAIEIAEIMSQQTNSSQGNYINETIPTADHWGTDSQGFLDT